MLTRRLLFLLLYCKISFVLFRFSLWFSFFSFLLFFFSFFFIFLLHQQSKMSTQCVYIQQNDACFLCFVLFILCYAMWWLVLYACKKCTRLVIYTCYHILGHLRTYMLSIWASCIVCVRVNKQHDYRRSLKFKRICLVSVNFTYFLSPSLPHPSCIILQQQHAFTNTFCLLFSLYMSV